MERCRSTSSCERTEGQSRDFEEFVFLLFLCKGKFVLSISTCSIVLVEFESDQTRSIIPLTLLIN